MWLWQGAYCCRLVWRCNLNYSCGSWDRSLRTSLNPYHLLCLHTRWWCSGCKGGHWLHSLWQECRLTEATCARQCFNSDLWCSWRYKVRIVIPQRCLQVVQIISAICSCYLLTYNHNSHAHILQMTSLGTVSTDTITCTSLSRNCETYLFCLRTLLEELTQGIWVTEKEIGMYYKINKLCIPGYNFTEFIFCHLTM